MKLVLGWYFGDDILGQEIPSLYDFYAVLLYCMIEEKICNFTVNRDHSNKSQETFVVTYTCRHSSGPNYSATAADWNTGMNCPLEYLQVSATTLVLALLLTVKLQFFPYTCLFAFQKHNNYNCFKKEWLEHASRITHKPVRFIHTQLCSVQH